MSMKRFYPLVLVTTSLTITACGAPLPESDAAATDALADVTFALPLSGPRRFDVVSYAAESLIHEAGVVRHRARLSVAFPGRAPHDMKLEMRRRVTRGGDDI